MFVVKLKNLATNIIKEIPHHFRWQDLSFSLEVESNTDKHELTYSLMQKNVKSRGIHFACFEKSYPKEQSTL